MFYSPCFKLVLRKPASRTKRVSTALSRLYRDHQGHPWVLANAGTCIQGDQNADVTLSKSKHTYTCVCVCVCVYVCCQPLLTYGHSRIYLPTTVLSSVSKWESQQN